MVVFRYKAFISYSWADAVWGKWLHHAIETYRTPRALIGTDGRHGPVPARLYPLFKDREEEAAGASIGEAVEAALGNSEFLIVVCSPRSAQSRWVNHEVAWFKTHREGAKILTLIVDGEPGHADHECFPAALTHRVTKALAVTDQPEDAPLAADARDSGDGKRGARLKLVAAMLGVGLDDLVRRDARRRARIRTFATAGACTIAAVMSVLAWNASVARDEALFQRNESQDLTEFMLTDLRGRLDEVGRLDILETVGKRLMASYDKQDLARLDADALGRRARVQLLLGEIENSRGNLAAALKTYQSAAATTAELLARDPDEPQRMFDHAQSLYWVGYIAWQRGDFAAAKRQFEGYDRMADGLLAANPNKIEWQLEKSYAQSNLGTVASDSGDLDASSRHFATALAIDRRHYQLKPRDADVVIQYGSTLSWLARVEGRRFDFARSESLYREGAELFAKAAAADPQDQSLQLQLAVTTKQHAIALVDTGRLRDAEQQGLRARDLTGAIVGRDPQNALAKEYLAGAILALAQIASARGNHGAADQYARDALGLLETLNKAGVARTSRQSDIASAAELVRARAAEASGDLRRSRELYALVSASAARRGLDQAGSLNVSIVAAAETALAGLTRDPRHWRTVIDTVRKAKGVPNPHASAQAGYALIVTGDRARGLAMLERLRNGGYRHPDFLTLLKRTGVPAQ